MLTNNDITRFPGGMNVAPQAAGDIFNSLPYPDYILRNVHRFEEDFYTYTAAQWTLTNVAGTGTSARTDGNGGLVLLSTDVNNNDQSQIQRIGSGITGESWLLDPNKPFFIDILATLNVLTANAYLGLAITDTTIIGGVSDGLAFRLATGGALTLVAEKDAAEASVAVGTITAATQFRASAFWDGQGVTNGKLYGALNGVIGGGVVPGAASFPDDEALTVSFALQTLTGAAKVLTLDRIVIAQQY